MGITETLGGIVRIETEPHNAVLSRHLSQMAEIDARTIAARKKLGQSPTIRTRGELHEVTSEVIGAMVSRLPRKRVMVVFNRHRISLPSVIYP